MIYCRRSIPRLAQPGLPAVGRGDGVHVNDVKDLMRRMAKGCFWPFFSMFGADSPQDVVVVTVRLRYTLGTVARTDRERT